MDENESLVDMSGEKVGNCVSLCRAIVCTKGLPYHFLDLGPFSYCKPNSFLVYFLL